MANKTYRKLLVNAFENIAQCNKWNDSKHSPVTMKPAGFIHAGAWARAFAACDIPDGGLGAMNDFLINMIEEAAREDRPLTQRDFDDFARDELYYLS